MLKKQRLASMEGKHHDKPPRYSRKGRIPTIMVGPCNMTEAEIQDAIHMTETGTDPATAVMLAKQHP